MSEVKKIEIYCQNDDIWFPSPISFGDMNSFDTSTLIGNQVECPKCNKLIGCNKENMRVTSTVGGFRGNDTF